MPVGRRVRSPGVDGWVGTGQRSSEPSRGFEGSRHSCWRADSRHRRMPGSRKRQNNDPCGQGHEAIEPCHPVAWDLGCIGFADRVLRDWVLRDRGHGLFDQSWRWPGQSWRWAELGIIAGFIGQGSSIERRSRTRARSDSLRVKSSSISAFSGSESPPRM